jgi:GNAT superfamily N-acetyltransferase
VTESTPDAEAPDSGLSDLPPGLVARGPEESDVGTLAALVAEHRAEVRGGSRLDPRTVAAVVTGTASWTRRQQLVEDATGRVLGWVSVHDRAGGRTMIDLVVRPGAEEGDAVASWLLAWARDAARDTARMRGLSSTQLDASPHADDVDLKRRLEAAGYRHVRTWLNLTRPTDDTTAFGDVREGVTVRQVAKHENGLPVAEDIQVVHQMLEESFADHFNSYRESFPEFLQRLREDPGHRWDHWWIAEVDDPDRPEAPSQPGGAVVSSVLVPDASGRAGSYVDYIGVHRRARGRGVAKALLGTVVRDAADRGRNRVDLEVDADSPTGADQLYAALGWTETDRTESWHADLDV